jgi:hypothetical protein
VVGSDGVQDRGTGVASTTRVSLGHYRVNTNVDVNQCSYTATIGDTGNIDDSSPLGGYARVGWTPGNTKSVTVLTFRNQTVLDDFPFHIQIAC